MCYKDKVGETGSTARGQAPVQTDMCGQNPETITIANMMMTLCSAQVATGSIYMQHSLTVHCCGMAWRVRIMLMHQAALRAARCKGCALAATQRWSRWSSAELREVRGAPPTNLDIQGMRCRHSGSAEPPSVPPYDSRTQFATPYLNPGSL